MAPRETPTRQPCPAEFVGTPRPLPRHSISSGGSPQCVEHGTPHPQSPPRASVPALPASWALSPPRWAPSPQGFQPQSPWPLPPQSPWPLPPSSAWPSSPPRIPRGASFCGASPLGSCSHASCSRVLSEAATSSSVANLPRQTTTSQYSNMSPICLSLPSPSPCNKRFTLPVPPRTPCKSATSLTTPSKIINITTPLRPCSRQKSKEIQDETSMAVAEQSVPLLRVIFQRTHNCPGEHALHEAVRQHQVPAVRLLLQGSADPNAPCKRLERGCEFPLQLATTCTGFLDGSGRAQAVELLLRAGASPNPRRTDAEANTPLHDAARLGDVRVAELLLEYGADPNVANGFGQMPLQLAIFAAGGDFASSRVAELLLVAGASPLAIDYSCVRRLAVAESTEVQALNSLLKRWSSWWRTRVLAWIRSRGTDHPLCGMTSDVMLHIAEFM